MKENKFAWRKLGLAALPIAFAIFALLYPNLPEQKLDISVLLLITLAVLIIILPWEYLTTLKAAGIELALNQPQIDKAIGDLGVFKGQENISDEQLRAVLERLAPEIEQSRGSRILWIDDAPDNVLGERRLFRALGIETVMAVSSQMAKHSLETDGDFDLIISDMGRGENSGEDGNEIPEAVRFVDKLREAETERRQFERYSHIPSLPVVFYSGKKYAELLHLTAPIRGPNSAIVLTTGVEMLFTEVLRTLSRVRSEPVQIVVGPTPKTT